MNAKHRFALVIVGVFLFAIAPSTQAAVTVDGIVSAGEGWTLLTENLYAAPYNNGSGSVGSSDQVGESSGFNWYSTGAGQNIDFLDNRGDVMNVYIAWDTVNLYLAVTGPTVPFNSWDNNPSVGSEPDRDNDQGDLYIAIDTAGGAASGGLSASGGHTTYGVKAVDFQGWTPTHMVGIQYVNNGGGGTGFANIERLSDHSTTGEGQNLLNGGFDWHGTINNNATYDNFNQNTGEFELAIPWSLLGLSAGGPAPGEPLRLAMYTTQNFAGYDAYDSGPGLGNTVVHEQIGDNPGDPDSNGQLGPTDPGSFGQPGSNEIQQFAFSPSHEDGVDTIEEYYSIVVAPVPEPSTFVLATVGLAGLWTFGRRRHATHSQSSNSG